MPADQLTPVEEDVPVDVPIGIVGGYGMVDRIDVDREVPVDTPFGEPSHPPIVGEMSGRQVVFLSRHGRGRNMPSQTVNFRANMFALYRLGVRRVLSATANGSLTPDLEIGGIGIPTDYIDRTKRRVDTFFDDYPPRHFNSQRPFCPSIRETALAACADHGVATRTEETTLVVIEGPRFSTTAESRMFRQWGAHVVGGSTYPEVALARELGLCYANFALITDHDAGVSVPEMDADPVTLATIDDRIEEYAARMEELVAAVVAEVPERRCEHCRGHVTDATSDGDPTWEHRREDLHDR